MGDNNKKSILSRLQSGEGETITGTNSKTATNEKSSLLSRLESGEGETLSGQKATTPVPQSQAQVTADNPTPVAAPTTQPDLEVSRKPKSIQTAANGRPQDDAVNNLSYATSVVKDYLGNQKAASVEFVGATESGNTAVRRTYKDGEVKEDRSSLVKGVPAETAPAKLAYNPVTAEQIQGARKSIGEEIQASQQYISKFAEEYKDQLGKHFTGTASAAPSGQSAAPVPTNMGQAIEQALPQMGQTFGGNQASEGVLSENNMLNRAMNLKGDSRALAAFSKAGMNILETEYNKKKQEIEAQYPLRQVASSFGSGMMGSGGQATYRDNEAAYRQSIAELDKAYGDKRSAFQSSVGSIAAIKVSNEAYADKKNWNDIDVEELGKNYRRALGDDAEVDRQERIARKGLAKPSQRVENQLLGHQALQYKMMDAIANDQDDVAKDLHARVTNYKQKVLDNNPTFKKEQIVSDLSNAVYQSKNPLQQSIFGYGVSDEELKEIAKSRGYTDKDLEGITADDISAPGNILGRIGRSFIGNTAAPIYEFGMRRAASIAGSDQDVVNDVFDHDWYDNHKLAGYVGGKAPEAMDFTRIGADGKSHFNWNLGAISNVIADGTGQIMSFATGGGMLGKGLKGMGLVKDVEKANRLGLTAWTYLTGIDRNYKQATDAVGDAPENEAKRMALANVYTIADIVGENILPDNQIAGKIFGGTVAGKELIELISKKGFGALTKDKASNLFLRGLKEGAKDWVKESSEDEISLVIGAFGEMLFAPENLAKRDLGGEMIETGVSSAIASMIPTMTGGMRNTYRQSSMHKNMMFEVGSNPDTYIAEIDKLVADGAMSATEGGERKKIVNTMQDIVATSVPEQSVVTGKPLTQRQKVDYANNLLQEAVASQQKERVKDDVQAEHIDEHIQKLKEARAEMLANAGTDTPIMTEYETAVADVERRRKSDLQALEDEKNGKGIKNKIIRGIRNSFLDEQTYYKNLYKQLENGDDFVRDGVAPSFLTELVSLYEKGEIKNANDVYYHVKKNHINEDYDDELADLERGSVRELTRLPDAEPLGSGTSQVSDSEEGDPSHDRVFSAMNEDLLLPVGSPEAELRKVLQPHFDSGIIKSAEDVAKVAEIEGRRQQEIQALRDKADEMRKPRVAQHDLDFGAALSGPGLSFYDKMMEALQKGTNIISGNPEKYIDEVKPLYDAGQIKTAEDLYVYFNSKKINAKYDAEIKALGGQPGNATQQNTEQNKGDDQSQNNVVAEQPTTQQGVGSQAQGLEAAAAPLFSFEEEFPSANNSNNQTTESNAQTLTPAGDASNGGTTTQPANTPTGNSGNVGNNTGAGNVAANSTQPTKSREEVSREFFDAPRGQVEERESAKVGDGIKQRFAGAEKHVGRKRTRVLNDGTKVSGRYVLTTAEAVTPSHDSETFATSEGFPLLEDGRNPNDRDYTMKENRDRVIIRSQSYDGRAIESIPTVDKNGVVVDGNDRTMSGQIAARQGTDGEYIDALKENADIYGFSADQVEDMKGRGLNPRVVFVTDEVMPYDTDTFAAFNPRSTGKVKTFIEEAIQFGRTAPAALFDAIGNIMGEHDSLADFFASKLDVRKVKDLLVRHKILNPDSVTGYYDNKGDTFTTHGKELLQNIMFGRAFTEDGLRLLQNHKDVKERVGMAMRNLISIEALGGDYSLKDALTSAIILKDRVGEFMRQNKMPASQFERGLTEYLQQGDLFGEEVSEHAILFLLAMEDSKKSKLREITKEYLDIAQEHAGNGGGMDIFGNTSATKKEILDDYVKSKKEYEQFIQANKERRNSQERGERSTEQGQQAVQGSSQESEAVGQGEASARDQQESVEVVPAQAQAQPTGESLLFQEEQPTRAENAQVENVAPATTPAPVETPQGSILKQATDLKGNPKEAWMKPYNSDHSADPATRTPLSTYIDAIVNGDFLKAIQDGRMTAMDAKNIIQDISGGRYWDAKKYSQIRDIEALMPNKEGAKPAKKSEQDAELTRLRTEHNKYAEMVKAKEAKLDMMGKAGKKGSEEWKREQAALKSYQNKMKAVGYELDQLEANIIAEGLRAHKKEENPDIVQAAMIPVSSVQLYNAAIEVAAQAVERGTALKIAIQQSVDYINDRWFTKWDEAAMRDLLGENATFPLTADEMRNLKEDNSKLSPKNKAAADAIVESIRNNANTLEGALAKVYANTGLSDQSKEKIARYLRTTVNEEVYKMEGSYLAINALGNTGTFDDALAELGQEIDTRILNASTDAERENLRNIFAFGKSYIESERTLSAVKSGVITPVSSRPDDSGDHVLELPERGVKDAARENMQDRYARLETVQRHARGVSSATDAVTALRLKKSKAFHQIDRIREYLGNTKSPIKGSLYDRMSKAGVDIQKFGLYLYAKHAQERNEYNANHRQEIFQAKVEELNQRIANTTDPKTITKLQEQLGAILNQENPHYTLMPDGGSGMTNQQAQDILDEVDAQGHTALYEDFNKEFKTEVIDKILDYKYDSGMIDEASYNQLKNFYQSYVPLKVDMVEERREEAKGGNFAGTRKNGRDLYRSKGASDRTFMERHNPMLQAIVDLENSIIKAEDNRAHIRLAKLAELNKNPAVWEVRPARYNYLKDRNGKVLRAEEIDRPQSAVPYFEDGVKKYVILHDKGLQNAFKQVGMGRFSSMIGAPSRFITTFATLRNPEFLLSNPIIDQQDAYMSLLGQEKPEVVKNFRSYAPKIFKIARAIMTGKGGEWANWLEDWKQNGGEVTFMQQLDIDKQAKATSKFFANYENMGSIKNQYNKAKGVLDLLSTALEQTTRLMAYRAAVEAGIPKERAAVISRNATVDFEKKGVYGSYVNSFKAFANAGTQGLANLSYLAIKSPKVRKFLGAMVLAGIAEAAINDLFSDCEGGNPENCYWEKPEWEKERNFMIRNPFGDGFFNLRTGRAFAWFNYLGKSTYAMIRGKLDPAEFAANTIGSIFSFYNPVGGNAPIEQQFAGNLAPIVQWRTNTNAFGFNISPDDEKVGLTRENYFPGTSKVFVEAADMMGRMTGGDDGQEGLIDISPNKLEFIMQSAFSGLYNFTTDAVGSASNKVNGEENQWKDIPIARIAYRESNMSKTKEKYYNLAEDSKREMFDSEKQAELKQVLEALVEGGQITEDQKGRRFNYIQKNQTAFRKTMGDGETKDKKVSQRPSDDVVPDAGVIQSDVVNTGEGVVSGEGVVE